MTKQQDDPIVRGEVTKQWWLCATLSALKKTREGGKVVRDLPRDVRTRICRGRGRRWPSRTLDDAPRQPSQRRFGGGWPAPTRRRQRKDPPRRGQEPAPPEPPPQPAAMQQEARVVAQRPQIQSVHLVTTTLVVPRDHTSHAGLVSSSGEPQPDRFFARCTAHTGG